MAKTLYIEDGILSALESYFKWHWEDNDDYCPCLVDENGDVVSADDFDFCPIEDTLIEAEDKAWEVNSKKMICDGVLLFGDGCMEFHDKIGQDAYNWDCFTDESVLSIESKVIKVLVEAGKLTDTKSLA